MAKMGKRIKTDKVVWKIVTLKRHWFNTIRKMGINLSQIMRKPAVDG